MVVKIAELYPGRQGRPESREALDPGAGVGLADAGHTALKRSIITYYGEIVVRDGNMVFRKAD